MPVEEADPPQRVIAETRNPVLLEIADLRLAYGSAVVIDGLGRAIRQGEISGIVGANGAGKTTLLKGISGLLRKRAGKILFRGQDITPLSPRKIIRAGVARPAGDLSHGDKRTVEIVRAMMSRPRLLLLDEPSSGLGNEEVNRLQQAIAAIARAGVTVILVEHHIALVRRVADEIVVLDQGVLIANGAVQDVLADQTVVDAYLGNVMSRGEGDRVAGPQTGTE